MGGGPLHLDLARMGAFAHGLRLPHVGRGKFAHWHPGDLGDRCLAYCDRPHGAAPSARFGRASAPHASSRVTAASRYRALGRRTAERLQRVESTSSPVTAEALTN